MESCWGCPVDLRQCFQLPLTADSARLLLQGTGACHGKLLVDGLLVRDLQVGPEARFAYLIRPLPARAKQLSERATFFRRRLLRVDPVSLSRRR